MFYLGPAEHLFKQPYYELLKTALKPVDGIIASQAGTVWENMQQVQSTFQHCKTVFPVATYAVTAVPTYPTGQIGFILGSLNSVSIKLNIVLYNIYNNRGKNIFCNFLWRRRTWLCDWLLIWEWEEREFDAISSIFGSQVFDINLQ